MPDFRIWYNPNLQPVKSDPLTKIVILSVMDKYRVKAADLLQGLCRHQPGSGIDEREFVDVAEDATKSVTRHGQVVFSRYVSGEELVQ